MKIETEFNIGQKVLFLYDNKVELGRVVGISFNCYCEGDVDDEVYKERLVYKVKSANVRGVAEFTELNLFSSKRDLLASL